jgi:hypothetical protein
MAAPTAIPADPPCWVGFSILSTIYDLDLAFFCLGYDGSVVGTNDVLAMQLLQHLEVCLGIVYALVLASVQEYRVVTHRILSFASVHDTFLIYSNLLSLREGSHHPLQCFP